MSVRTCTRLSRQWLACVLLAHTFAFAAPFAYTTNSGSGAVSVLDTPSKRDAR